MRIAPPRKAIEVVTWKRVVEGRVYGLGERVAWRAAELGISVSEVARRMGIKPSRLFWLLASSHITSRMLHRLIAALDWESERELHRPLPVLETAARVAADKIFGKKE